MRRLSLFSLLFLYATSCPVVFAQSDSRVTEMMATFLDVYNQDDPVLLHSFLIKKSDRETDVDAEVDYWSGVYSEVGSLEYVGTVLDGPPGRQRQVFWHRGQITGAWIGLRLELDADGLISGRGVMRGVRPSVAPVVEAIDPSCLTVELDAYLARVAQEDHFSGSVIVARGGELVFQGAFGWANRQESMPVTLNTPFRLASVSKLFSGVAIAQLVEAGTLSLEDPINKFLPEYPEHIATQVTVRHLLTHSSGIELDDNPAFNAAVGEAKSMEDLLAVQLAHISQLNSGNYEEFTPPERFDYTNEGIDLLGVIIERASGISWSEYLRINIFEPAGMLDTGAHFLEDVPDLAQSYTTRPAEIETAAEPGDRRSLRENESTTAWKIRPAGSAYSTAPDMLRFLSAIQNCEILSCAMVKEVTSPQIEIPVPPGVEASRSYGLAFSVDDTRTGIRAVGHTGGAPGQSTVVQFYPELGYAVVILSNYGRTQWWLNMRIQEMIGAQ